MSSYVSKPYFIFIFIILDNNWDRKDRICKKQCKAYYDDIIKNPEDHETQIFGVEQARKVRNYFFYYSSSKEEPMGFTQGGFKSSGFSHNVFFKKFF